MAKFHFINSHNISDGIPEISVTQVKEVVEDLFLIDVRRDDEWIGELGHIENAKLVTLGDDLNDYSKGLDKESEIVIVCRSGKRSAGATQMLIELGFKNVYNMAGGMIAWNEASFEVKKT